MSASPPAASGKCWGSVDLGRAGEQRAPARRIGLERDLRRLPPAFRRKAQPAAIRQRDHRVVGDRHAFGLAAGEDMALVEEGMPVDSRSSLTRSAPIALRSRRKRATVSPFFRSVPRCDQLAVRRPAVARRIVGRGVAEGRAEEIARETAEMRRRVVRHFFAQPRHLVQHRDLAPVALDDQFGDHPATASRPLPSRPLLRSRHVPSVDAPSVAIPVPRKHLLTAPKGRSGRLAMILERKFHFLTIGNLCAVVSVSEFGEGSSAQQEGHGRLSHIPRK